MARYSDTVRDQNEAAVPGALIAVTLSSTGDEPVMTDDEGATLANPLTSDTYGVFYFNIVGAEYVDLKFYYGGRLALEQFGVPVGAVAPETGAGGTDGQAQYNDGGALAGFDGLTIGGTDDLTAVDIEQGTITTPAYALTVASAWNDATGNLTFGQINQTITKTSVGPLYHTAQNVTIDGLTKYRLLTTGESQWRQTGAPYGVGIRCEGGGNQLTIGIGPDTISGQPQTAGHTTYYWEANIVGAVAVSRANGSNRRSDESLAAYTHIAGNGLFEWETGAAGDITFVGYQTGSASGRAFLFNNYNQTPTQTTVVAKFGVQVASQFPIQAGTWNGTTFAANFRITGDGTMFLANTSAPATPTAGGVLYVESGSGKFKTSAGNIVTFAPASVPNVTGSRGGNAALASLLTALASLGLITDGST